MPIDLLQVQIGSAHDFCSSRMASSVKSREEQDDEPPMSRLFIICNKTNTEEEFRESFSKFGTIEEIWIVKDKLTGEHKGIYVHIHTPSLHPRTAE